MRFFYEKLQITELLSAELPLWCFVCSLVSRSDVLSLCAPFKIEEFYGSLKISAGLFFCTDHQGLAKHLFAKHWLKSFQFDATPGPLLD